MRLLKVRVQDFRSIEDSGEFSLADVTCLVGKNESGKTALLKAMLKLNPVEGSSESFVPARDYPRRKWKPDTAIPTTPPAITTRWRLDDADVSALEKMFGRDFLRSREFVLTKSHDNKRTVSVSIDESVPLNAAIDSAKVTGEDREPLTKCTTVIAARTILSAITQRTTGQEQLLQVLIQKYPSGTQEAVIDAIAARIPRFLYFDEYLTLPGEVSLNEIQARTANNTLTARDRVFVALLGMAGTSAEKLNSSGTFEEFNASMRAASNQISDQIFQYWSQNKHLDVDVRLDHARQNDKPPFNQGWICRTRIENKRHRNDTSFDDRSSGFVWFFSFLVWFNHLQKQYDSNLIILLDEPGLSLHARAQGDLLRYINEKLRPRYQVVYTTHSPFMIDPDNLLSARTVEDVVVRDKTTGEDKLLGTKVGEDVLSFDQDTISPLQRALDYQMTQTLFVGRNTLLVEGPSDLLYLKWFSRQLEKAGKPGLDYRWTISIVGGVDRVPGFVSLFRANGLNIAALVDRQTGDKQKVEKAEKSLPPNHVFSADKYANQSQADIEDVLGREFYVALVNTALELQPQYEVPAQKPDGTPERVVKEVSDFAATLPPHVKEYDHFVPAEWLYRHDGDGSTLNGFSTAMDRMEKLIGDVNALRPS